MQSILTLLSGLSGHNEVAGSILIEEQYNKTDK